MVIYITFFNVFVCDRTKHQILFLYFDKCHLWLIQFVHVAWNGRFQQRRVQYSEFAWCHDGHCCHLRRDFPIMKIMYKGTYNFNCTYNNLKNDEINKKNPSLLLWVGQIRSAHNQIYHKTNTKINIYFF